MEFCPHCMRPTEGSVCPNCGGQVNCTAGAGQLPVGSLLRGADGHMYQVGAARGQGGFGITYAAMDLNTGERIAIKEYFPTRCAQRTQLNQVVPMTGQNDNYQGGMRSFLEEAMMLSAVGAVPSVVTVKDYFEANGTAYLAMEFVDGVPLHQIVSQRGKIPAAELLPKCKGLLHDLDILHRAGIIHRDISPDNLIWQPDGTLKLLDFGSARSVQDGKSMTVLLKAGFSPVEQYQTRGQGPWTDVYALAGTIYYCLTGVIPPSAVDRLDQDELQPPTALGAELTTEQEKALLWGLVVQPKSRPASMEVFSQRLYPKTTGASTTIPKAEFVQKAAEKAAELGKTIKSTIEATKAEANTKMEDKPTPEPASEPVVEPKVTPEPPPTPDKPKQPSKSKAFWKRQFRFSAKSVGKRFLRLGIVLAALLLLVGIISGIVHLATHGTTDDGFKYEIRHGSVYIKNYVGTESHVVIPETIRKKTVTDIDFNAFDDCETVTSVAIPRNIDWISYSSFDDCPNLQLVISKCDEVLSDNYFGSSLRCVLFSDQSVYQKHIDQDRFSDMPSVVLCHVGQDTGFGQIKNAVVDEAGVVFAITNLNKAVVLGMPDGMSPDLLAGRTVNGCPIVLLDGTTPGVEPEPEPDPEPLYGTTEDGYEYMITADRTECWITGYVGSDKYLYTPDEVDDIPITRITEGAFAGNSTVESFWMPFYLETVEANAFKNCTNMRDIYVYSNVASDSTSFANCSSLRCLVRMPDVSISGWRLNGSCEVYDFGMETGAGELKYVEVMDDGTIYATTEDYTGILMHVLSTTDHISIPDNVVWVYEDALDDVDPDIVIEMPDYLMFPAELAYKADWTMKEGYDQFTFSYNWFMSCMMCQDISRLRDLDMTTSQELVKATMTRAEELAQSYSADRPDGSDFGTVLDEYGVDWSYASISRARFDTSEDGYNSRFGDKLDSLTELYAAPEEENDNQYYRNIAIALYYDQSAGMLYVACMAVMN